jgi:MFS family permease
VVLLANLGLAGGFVGFVLGGHFVDRFGTRYVFLFCHFGFGACLLGFPLREIMPLPTMVWIGVLHVLVGLIGGASSIAMSTELLALIPKTNTSVATSLCISLTLGATSLSSLIAAWALDLDLLNDSWRFVGHGMSAYDSILLLYGGMVVLMVVTLGLVPSVLHKAEWRPREM